MICGENETWKWLGASVQGSSHLQAGKENQDSIASEAFPWGFCLAIADGHGSEKCFRSKIGSMVAVSVAVEEAGRFLQSFVDSSRFSEMKAASSRLPALIFAAWRKRIEAYHQENPFKDIELQNLRMPEEEKVTSSFFSSDDFFLAYGTTLSAVIVGKQFLVAVKIGDGEILFLDSPNCPAKKIFQRDSRNLANETDSLALPPKLVRKYFECHFQAISDSVPMLILLCTDGYSNSFRDPAGFYQVPGDLIKIIQAEGMKFIVSKLPEWLEENTMKGSGDDVSMAFAFRKILGKSETGIQCDSSETKEGNSEVQKIKESERK